MRYAVCFLALLLVAGSIQADHKRSRCTAATCWSSTTTNAAEAPKPTAEAKPATTQVKSTTNTVEASGTCASGTCGTSSTAGGIFRRRR